MSLPCTKCGACCVAPDIAALDKPLGLVCPHLGPDALCTQYERRPQVCRDYQPDELCERIAAPTLDERVAKYLALFGLTAEADAVKRQRLLSMRGARLLALALVLGAGAARADGLPPPALVPPPAPYAGMSVDELRDARQAAQDRWPSRVGPHLLAFGVPSVATMVIAVSLVAGLTTNPGAFTAVLIACAVTGGLSLVTGVALDVRAMILRNRITAEVERINGVIEERERTPLPAPQAPPAPAGVPIAFF